ncbi:latexin [Ascaphus truei]|uniref:latexin n=1 Tax=Ascaphus truei TaxID=8439 RepID=UPI003F5AC5EE
METLNPSHYPATRAATVAANYINYKLGSPHRLFELQPVTQASRQSIAGVGRKYHLVFSIKDSLNDGAAVTCTAEVLYHTNGQNAAPEVSFIPDSSLEKDTQDRDEEFYNTMNSLKEPLVAQDIPDKFGNVAPEMMPILHLALVACGYVKWQNSTEGTLYSMAVIQSVKQLKREDAALELHYVMLIHEMVSQEMIPWQLDILWDPTEGLKIIQQVRLPHKAT